MKTSILTQPLSLLRRIEGRELRAARRASLYFYIFYCFFADDHDLALIDKYVCEVQDANRLKPSNVICVLVCNKSSVSGQ